MKKSALGKKWVISNQQTANNKQSAEGQIVDILLKNRGLRTKKDKKNFLNPPNPNKITLKDLEILSSAIKKSVARIKKAIKNKEKILIYGDYDADGICAAAILWEALYKFGADATPYIPERFSEGYGINSKTVETLKYQNSNLKLIMTVDNGIVANEAVKTANKLGIDVIITDHHQKGKKIPKAYSIIHTTTTSGSGFAWFLARELGVKDGLELVAIGTIADQVPLLGVNRSLVKYGLGELNKTKRPGLMALFAEAAIQRGMATPYTVGFMIAPRINAMGRLSHGLDSLRLLCTKNVARAHELAHLLGKTNKERQRIVEEVSLHARGHAKDKDGFIIVSHESYHEGVIGLAASKLVEEFWRPAIVISRGDRIAKASARSIPGVNIIEVIRKAGDLLINGGGHEMAAGFSLETAKLDLFSQKLQELAKDYLTADLLQKTLKIDLELHFSQINRDLYSELCKFDPTGMGNPTPTFVSKKVKVEDSRLVGAEGKHLKLKLNQDDKTSSAIAFGMGGIYPQLKVGMPIDAVYSIEEDGWNGRNDLQLKIRDIKL